jgi:DNA-directed RNA polymerase subunit M/transcription elongation factor TFIIS
MGRPDNIKKLSLILNENNAKIIEQSIFNFAKEYADLNETPFLYDSIYNDKFSEIYNILVSENSSYIINMIKNNAIDLIKIAYMKPNELNPEKYNTILEKQNMETKTKKEEATSTNHKCSKCGDNKCNVVQKQTRSADEPATLYVECKTCGHTTVIED